jgi:peptidoglycan/xylan/chitin deacetylase (PgdA/CDA1 family)
MKNNIIALTFDDGPSEHTERILDTLERHDARATFFVVGRRAESGKSTIKRAFDMGCEIANHSWTHPRLSKLSAGEVMRELNDTSAAIEAVTGVCPKIFRPPYGAVSDILKSVCAELKLPIINWSVDPLDWECQNADMIFNRIASKTHDRAIILSHDVYASTAEAMERVIPELICRGYRLVTVSELMCCSGITPIAGEIYDNG